MTTQQLLTACLRKGGSFVDHPFGPEATIVKVGDPQTKQGRIFAQLFVLDGRASVTFHCDAMTGAMYRSLFPGVVARGYHCPPVQQPYFNTLPVDGVPDPVLLDMLDHSYATVVAKLPKTQRQNLGLK